MLDLSSKKLQNLGRRELLLLLQRNRELYLEWIRRMVLEHHRFDILAEAILGYKVEPHHLRIIQHQYNNPWSQTLVWRGAGKTTVGTIAYAIGCILVNRDTRILIASKTAENARDFLKEIKLHFESNEKLREVFGNLVGDEKWDGSQIQVRGRTKPMKEPTINTVGLEGAVASKHYDIVIPDDLVDEENSRTKGMRDRNLDWFYKSLVPCLNPPVADDPFVGRMHVIGTRYHYDDLYGHLQEVQPDGTGGEMGDGRTLIIPVISPEGVPAWPGMFPVEVIDKLRSMGVIRFNTQYICDCEAMKGQIFRYDDCIVMADDDIPPLDRLRVYMGVDPAISEEETADMFAMVAIGVDTNKDIYVLDYLEAQIRFNEQTAKIKQWNEKWQPLRIGIESNAYQKALYQALKDDDKSIPATPIITVKDKVTRAQKQTPKFENGQMHFRRNQFRLIEHLVLFPGARYKDLFDALDLAIQASEKRQRKPRREPGVL